MVNKIYISHTEFSGMVDELLGAVGPYRNKYKMILGIANGGLAISHCFSYFLNIPHKTISIRLRDGDGSDRDAFSDSLVGINKPFLWIDDIIDSGNTLRYFKSFGYLQGVDFDVATLHWCPENSGEEKPDYYVAIKKVTEWIVYPWEKEYEENKISEDRSRKS